MAWVRDRYLGQQKKKQKADLLQFHVAKFELLKCHLEEGGVL